MQPSRHSYLRFLRVSWASSIAALAIACGGGGGGGAETLQSSVGTELPKPGGGAFFVDSNLGGNGARLRLVEVQWGRLVDVYDVDSAGDTGPTPVFRDVLIDENLLTDNVDFRLETNPVTYLTRLVVLRTRGAPNEGNGSFESLFRAARITLPVILPLHDDGSSLGPFSLMPRNAALSLRFDDLLDDSAEAEESLPEMLRLLTGYTPTIPVEARIRFDPNHGGLRSGSFHSTRVLMDMSISEAEAASASTPLQVNVLGAAASQVGRPEPNLSIHIPTRLDPNSGQLRLLKSVRGVSLSPTGNGPVASNPTADIVRAMRIGNEADLNRGFLLDSDAPRLVGGWPLTILDARPVQGAESQFQLDVRFTTVCRSAPRADDILRIGNTFLQVTEDSSALGPTGEVFDVEVVLIAGQAPSDPFELRGQGLFLNPYDISRAVPSGCWVTVTPAPTIPPVDQLSSGSQFLVRFSEPMQPSTVRAFDSLRLVRGALGVTPAASEIVIGEVVASDDLREFTLRPVLPLDNRPTNRYRLELGETSGEVRDFAGNGLSHSLPSISYTLSASEPPERNGGIALRFSSMDELEPFGLNDFRGQALWDEVFGVLRGRDVIASSNPVDRLTGLVRIMTPFARGVQTPLTPLGSKMQTIWRYVDLGWFLEDETKFNIDVTGMSWSPNLNSVLSDFYPRFEMRLGHANQMPDEEFTPAGGPFFPYSGLADAGIPYEANYLEDPLATRPIVHPASRGYLISQADVYTNLNGTPLVPFPMNRGPETPLTYTWRDTSILAVGGNFGLGVPISNELQPPFNRPGSLGSYALAGSVPSIALPLLWEIRCFPTTLALGLNPLRIMIPTDRYRQPLFRNFSSGGTDVNNQQILVDPAREDFATGGFNPTSTPPGSPTMFVADNTFYVGQLDLVTRISRTHTIWLDVSSQSKRFAPPVFEPSPGFRPQGTTIVVDYRGAEGFVGVDMQPFDADQLNPYGDFKTGSVNYSSGAPTWSSDPDDFDASPFLQLRFTFIGNTQSQQVPEMDSFGLGWIEQS